MANTLEDLTERLDQIVEAIPANIQKNAWNIPSINKADLVAEAESISRLIEHHEAEFDIEDEEQLTPLVKRLDFLLANTIPQLPSQAAGAIPAYLFTLQQVRRRLLDLLPPPDSALASQQITRIKRRIRSMEARLNDVEPRSERLESMLERIEAAHEAADQLPTDLESLDEAKLKIAAIKDKASSDGAAVESLFATIKEQEETLHRIGTSATAILEKCETAYASSTSVGLAAAFSERSTSLSRSIYVWVIGLVIALVLAGVFGSQQLDKLTSLMTSPNIPISIAILNLLLAIFSVGAPIWFAWLATKQIGQRFRLAEDYAFKASISRAYEGYRREAARIDEAFGGHDMEAQLLQSALTRLDELPLRLVETPTHGSPWSEMLQSDVIREAVKTVPGFVGQVKDFAATNIATFKGSRQTRADEQQSPKSEETTGATRDE